MKQHRRLLFVLSAMTFLAGCSTGNTSSASYSTKASKDDGSYTGGATTSVSVDDSGFSIETSDGAYTVADAVYTISSYGTYTLSGTLVGQIFVNVDESTSGDETVELDLNGVDISYAGNSPIYVKSADEVKIKAVKNTVNKVTDLRALEDEDNADDYQGAGAIYAKADLKFVGTGSLTVVGAYNNGVHSTKDLKIKNQTLHVTAPNNAIKGSNSLTIESGTITAISTAGDALKTSDGSVSNSKQRGNITITGGMVNAYANNDALDAAYNVVIAEGEDDDGNATSPTINIKTGSYSSYSSSAAYVSTTSVAPLAAFGGGGRPGDNGGGWPGDPGNNGGQSSTKEDTESAKGMKAANAVNISGGTIVIQSADDGIHANYGDALDSDGNTGVGDVLVSGGSINVTTSDDALHADRYLRISGGSIKVNTAYEALEGNQIYISGGTMDIYATNDAANAGNSSNMAGLTPYFEVSGGYLFAAVPSSGDVDCIDSNGSYKQTGGVVIACGPSTQMAASLDTDGTVNVSGGTLLLFGTSEKTPSRGSGVTSSSLSGSWGRGNAYTVTFSNSYAIDTKAFPSSYSYTRSNCWSTNGSLSSIK